MGVRNIMVLSCCLRGIVLGILTGVTNWIKFRKSPVAEIRIMKVSVSCEGLEFSCTKMSTPNDVKVLSELF